MLGRLEMPCWIACGAAVFIAVVGGPKATFAVEAQVGAGDSPVPFVDAATRVAGLKLDIRYATDNNFMGEKLYPVARCFLRPEAAAKLARAAELLKGGGYGLLAHDCYRPLSVQKKMWAKFPKKGYVMPPVPGSNHNRGAAVDLALYDLSTGAPVAMPSPYDEFSEKAHHSYKGAPQAQLKARDALRTAMVAAGFVINPTEWWHYDDPSLKAVAVLDEDLTAVATALDAATKAPSLKPKFGAKGGCAGEAPGGVAVSPSKGDAAQPSGQAAAKPAPAAKTGDCELKL
jgi:zinc D-Ala-D-Ala dipeptidase